MLETPTLERCTLSTVEFDVVWRALGFGPPPVVLGLPSPGRSYTERRAIEADAWAGLHHRGVVRETLDRLLQLLATPAPRLELRAWGTVNARAVTGGSGDDAVLAQRWDDTVLVEPSPSVPDALVGVLPPYDAGPGRAANVPTADLAAALARRSEAGLRADLVERGVGPDEADLLRRMLDGIERRVQVVAVVPDRWGTPRRSGQLLDVLDGSAGRYLMTRSHADDGTSWTTIAPVDDRRLRHRVAALLDGPDEAQSRSPWRMSCRPDSVIEPDREG